jgi:hypothetical protein
VRVPEKLVRTRGSTINSAFFSLPKGVTPQLKADVHNGRRCERGSAISLA